MAEKEFEASRKRGSGAHLTVARSLASLPGKDGRRFAELFTHHGLSVEIYAPRGVDSQTPHTRDEVYVVISGRGRFRNGEREHGYQPGDLLFVPAGQEHRFENFSDNLVVWVIFYGPEGGEAGMA